MFAGVLKGDDNNSEVELKVLLPNQSILNIRIQRNYSTDSVFKVCKLMKDLHFNVYVRLRRENAQLNYDFQKVATKVGLDPESAESFALFEIEDHNFGTTFCFSYKNIFK